jgi:hypothetical protein
MISSRLSLFLIWGLALLSLVACSTLNPTRVPNVSLNVNPQQGQAPLTITASAQASDPDGDSLTYTWFVGNERIIGTNRLTTTLHDAGNVPISVVVSDGRASNSAQQMIIVTGSAPPNDGDNDDGGDDGDSSDDGDNPINARFNVTRDQTLTVSLSANYPPASDITYRWDFGDGNTFTASDSAGATVNHTYNSTGRYRVQLEVRRQGENARTSQTITLNPDDSDNPDTPSTPRPNDAPDVVIMGFAGRCGSNDAFFSCDAPRVNRAYLDTQPQPGTLQALQSNLEQQGYSVTIRSFVGRLSADEPSITVPAPDGYLEAEAYVQEVYDNWIRNQTDPTRLIVVGHSHGAVWMNLLLLNHPDIPFDYAISLDGVCSFWWADHEDAINAHYGSSRRPLEGDPCNSFVLPNIGSVRDLDDVIPDNVRINLEVQSSPTSLPFDDQNNFRLDGGQQDIYRFIASQTHTGINGVHQANRDAMNWVNRQITSLGFEGN